MPNEFRLFYVTFLTVRLYIQLDQFIISQVTLPTLFHQLPSGFYWFLNVASEPLEHCNLLYPSGCSWVSPYQTHKNLDYLQLEIVNINPHRDKNLVAPTVCVISRQILYRLIHQRSGHVCITRLKKMVIKGLMEGLPKISLNLKNTALSLY